MNSNALTRVVYLSAFERSVFSFANTSVYTTTIGSDDKVLGRLSAEEWAKAASGSVGVVALLYAPVHDVMAADTGGGGAWMAAALAAMAAPPGVAPTSSADTAAAAAAAAAPGPALPPSSADGSGGGASATAVDALRMALFPCGCVIPSAYFAAVDVRMGGRECTLLPGYVFPAPRVAWAVAAADALRPLAPVCAASRAAASAYEDEGEGWGGRWQTLVAEARQQLPVHVVAAPPADCVDDGGEGGGSIAVGGEG
ncbi:hypothetical protein I4F81_003390 [Pyropia yezoensis]|uniref:Uncharacterized protein n=1 Tax=Pyropia yezoensis TaxID=2788 RepID=A0ACC3BT75_PYRYE|nr:hypothetical protein I4F81_003390 [Neopyropia yezoensis]